MTVSSLASLPLCQGLMVPLPGMNSEGRYSSRNVNFFGGSALVGLGVGISIVGRQWKHRNQLALRGFESAIGLAPCGVVPIDRLPGGPIEGGHQLWRITEVLSRDLRIVRFTHWAGFNASTAIVATGLMTISYGLWLMHSS